MCFGRSTVRERGREREKRIRKRKKSFKKERMLSNQLSIGDRVVILSRH